MKLCNRSKRRGIIGAGNWIVDRLKVIDRWPEVGELCNVTSELKSPGGGPCNVLFGLAALQADLPLFAAGRLGTDADGDWLMHEIASRGIDGRFMRRSVSNATSHTEVMGCDGKRTFFHRRGANADFSLEDLAGIDMPASIFYLGYLLLLDKLDREDADYGTAAARLLAEMRRKGYFTVVDFVSEAAERFARIVPHSLPHIDALVINEIEGGHASGYRIRQANGQVSHDSLRQAARALLDAGVNELVAIHFPEGAYALTRSEECYQPSCPIKSEDIVDSTGAGDAFCAGLIYGLHENKSLRELLQWGTVSARFNLISSGASAGAPTKDMIAAASAKYWG
jgi:sugar/nucleoside kinase (ribokinase family)